MKGNGNIINNFPNKEMGGGGTLTTNATLYYPSAFNIGVIELTYREKEFVKEIENLRKENELLRLENDSLRKKLQEHEIKQHSVNIQEMEGSSKASNSSIVLTSSQDSHQLNKTFPQVLKTDISSGTLFNLASLALDQTNNSFPSLSSSSPTPFLNQLNLTNTTSSPPSINFPYNSFSPNTHTIRHVKTESDILPSRPLTSLSPISSMGSFSLLSGSAPPSITSSSFVQASSPSISSSSSSTSSSSPPKMVSGPVSSISSIPLNINPPSLTPFNSNLLSATVVNSSSNSNNSVSTSGSVSPVNGFSSSDKELSWNRGVDDLTKRTIKTGRQQPIYLELPEMVDRVDWPKALQFTHRKDPEKRTKKLRLMDSQPSVSDKLTSKPGEVVAIIDVPKIECSCPHRSFYPFLAHERNTNTKVKHKPEVLLVYLQIAEREESNPKCGCMTPDIYVHFTATIYKPSNLSQTKYVGVLSGKLYKRDNSREIFRIQFHLAGNAPQTNPSVINHPIPQPVCISSSSIIPLPNLVTSSPKPLVTIPAPSSSIADNLTLPPLKVADLLDNSPDSKPNNFSFNLPPVHSTPKPDAFPFTPPVNFLLTNHNNNDNLKFSQKPPQLT